MEITCVELQGDDVIDLLDDAAASRPGGPHSPPGGPRSPAMGGRVRPPSSVLVRSLPDALMTLRVSARWFQAVPYTQVLVGRRAD